MLKDGIPLCFDVRRQAVLLILASYFNLVKAITEDVNFMAA
jgi:hypothetical protein